jgi:hypothetical protein
VNISDEEKKLVEHISLLNYREEITCFEKEIVMQVFFIKELAGEGRGIELLG